MAETAGMKRPHSTSTLDDLPRKKRKVQRRLHHLQHRPLDVEPAPQNPVFAQGQLLRSITAALAMVGFDSVKPSALEMFRSSVEEYMLHFLHLARTSMTSSRRTKPIAMDFAAALALTPNTSTASLLQPQLALDIPPGISHPSIPPPERLPAPAPDFSALLQPLITTQTPPYIPAHFPRLPPQHAWKRTPVFPERERDARKMRERATEEGILAEQALRKLAAAAKSGAVKAERRKEAALSGPGRKMERARRRGGEDVGAEGLFGDMMFEVGEGEVDPVEAEAMELSVQGAQELRGEGIDAGMPEGVVVNSEMGGWRRGGKKGLRL